MYTYQLSQVGFRHIRKQCLFFVQIVAENVQYYFWWFKFISFVAHQSDKALSRTCNSVSDDVNITMSSAYNKIHILSSPMLMPTLKVFIYLTRSSKYRLNDIHV